MLNTGDRRVRFRTTKPVSLLSQDRLESRYIQFCPHILHEFFMNDKSVDVVRTFDPSMNSLVPGNQSTHYQLLPEELHNLSGLPGRRELSLVSQ